MSRSVFLGIPTYNQTISTMTATTALNAMMEGIRTQTQVYWATSASSLLPHGFNMLWATACQVKPDYFCMLHSDIGAEDGWMTTLIDELESRQADVISCVVPIKDDNRLTSTAAFVNGDARKLTYDEIEQLPITFDAEDLQRLIPESEGLLLNTGLWIAKHGEWWREWPGFKILSAIKWVSDVEHKLLIRSEDWEASDQWRKMGKKLLATSKVKLHHHGWRTWESPQSTLLHGTSTEA